jgi:hypothetical protein
LATPSLDWSRPPWIGHALLGGLGKVAKHACFAGASGPAAAARGSLIFWDTGIDGAYTHPPVYLVHYGLNICRFFNKI